MRLAWQIILIGLFIFLFPFGFACGQEKGISLSAEERAYLDSHDTIVFISQTDYPPFEFLNNDGMPDGMTIELLRWLATEIGFRSRFKDTSFLKAQKAILSGEADVLTSFFYSEKRDQSFDFSQPLFEVPASIFVLADRPDIVRLQDLSGKRIAIQQGDYAKDFLDTEGIDFTMVPTRNFSEATDAVISGSADLLIGDEQIVLYYLYSHGLTDKVKKVGEPLYSGINCMGLKNDNRVLQSILNKGISYARTSGVLDSLTGKWLGTKYPSRTDYWAIFWPYAAAVLALTLFIVAWNIRLRRAVELKTRHLRESEQKFKTIFDQSFEFIGLMNPDGTLLDVNRTALKFVGQEKASLLNRPFWETAWWQHSVEARNQLRAATLRAAAGEVVQFETTNCSESGEIHTLDVSITPIFDAKGQVSLLIPEGRDITERKQTEQALLHELNLFIDLLNTQPAGIYRIRVYALENWKKDAWLSSSNAPYSIELVSDVVCNILGVTKETFEKTPGIINDLIYPDDKEEFAKKNEAAAAHLETFTWEGRLLIDGVIRWINFQSLPRPLENGDVLWTGVLLDITERKREEEEKQIFEQQLQYSQKLESLGVLSGGIAHDFNNILAIIIGYCGLIKLKYETAEKNIPKIEKAAERAAGLCRQMLAYAGKEQLTKTKINMVTNVDEIVGMLKSTLPQNAGIKTDLSARIPFVVGDISQLRQVVMNLIINASEAIGTEQGEVTVSLARINVDAGKSYVDYHSKAIPPGEYVCLEVSDSGCGMDEATKSRIFEPFYTTKFAGRGLGMSAVLGIVKSHAGALQLFSQLGQGTTFKVYLPALSSEIDCEEVQSIPVPVALWQGSGTVLLAEDEEQVRHIAKELLEMFGFTVLEAVNGKEALEIYQKNATAITLVLTDIGMPVMDGYQLFSELKILKPELPIIVSSGYGDVEVNSRIGFSKFTGIINKPYNAHQLREVLKTVVDGTKLDQG